MPLSRGERDRAFRRHLGQALSHLRKNRGMRQREVSRRAALSVEYISRLENGRANPTLLTLRALVEDGMGQSLKGFCREYMTS